MLSEYYEKKLFRKFKWNSYINKQKSESKMINNFKRIFGEPENVLVCIGDFDQKKQMKYKEPSKGKSFRKLFKLAKYDVFLVDEHKTSKMNFFTQTENEKFRERLNPRPWRKDIRKIHGLLRSKCDPNNRPVKTVLVNRDLNASLNIRKIAVNAILNLARPTYLSRN